MAVPAEPEHVPPYLDKQYPAVYKQARAWTTEIRSTYADVDLPLSLVELVNVRVSQINGCATCLGIHTDGARRAGVTQRQLDVLEAWRDVELFDAREKAALALAESLTRPWDHHPEDTLAACEYFAEEQVAALEWAIIAINAFNRISIASHHPVI